ncbi:hypothetical protein LSAT2_004714 [Lamellibrachia satsuma]|nr:hypothetical protein LSAT2_004714 [Lamellibrachia satsuma]
MRASNGSHDPHEVLVMPGDTWLPPILSKTNSNTSHADFDSYSSSSENRTSATPPSPSSGRSSGSSRGLTGYPEHVSVTPFFPVIEHRNSVDSLKCVDVAPYRRGQRQKLCRSPSCPQLHVRDGEGNLVTSRPIEKQGGHRKNGAIEREDLTFPAIHERNLAGIRETGVKSVSPTKQKRKARHLVKQNSKSDPDISRACERSLDNVDRFGLIPLKRTPTDEIVPNRNALLWPIKEADLKTEKKRLANSKRNNRVNCAVNAGGKCIDGGCESDSETA